MFALDVLASVDWSLGPRLVNAVRRAALYAGRRCRRARLEVARVGLRQHRLPLDSSPACRSCRSPARRTAGRSAREPTTSPPTLDQRPVRLAREDDLAMPVIAHRVDEAEQDREDDDGDEGGEEVAAHLSNRWVVRPATIGPSSSAGKNVSAPTRTITPISSTTNVGVVGAHRARAGRARRFLPASAPAIAEREAGSATKRANSIVEAAEQVGEGHAVRADVAGVRLDEAGVAGERRAVVVGLARCRRRASRRSPAGPPLRDRGAPRGARGRERGAERARSAA